LQLYTGLKYVFYIKIKYSKKKKIKKIKKKKKKNFSQNIAYKGVGWVMGVQCHFQKYFSYSMGYSCNEGTEN
jgi:hypothetical protein